VTWNDVSGCVNGEAARIAHCDFTPLVVPDESLIARSEAARSAGGSGAG